MLAPSLPQRIVAYLQRRQGHSAPVQDIARVLGVPVTAVSQACNRMAWNRRLDYVLMPSRGPGIGVWRLHTEAT